MPNVPHPPCRLAGRLREISGGRRAGERGKSATEGELRRARGKWRLGGYGKIEGLAVPLPPDRRCPRARCEGRRPALAAAARTHRIPNPLFALVRSEKGNKSGPGPPRPGGGRSLAVVRSARRRSTLPARSGERAGCWKEERASGSVVLGREEQGDSVRPVERPTGVRVAGADNGSGRTGLMLAGVA